MTSRRAFLSGLAPLAALATQAKQPRGTGLQGMVDALPPSGGTLSLPPGLFILPAPLILDGRRSVVIRGAGSPTGGAYPATTISYRGPDAACVMSARSTAGLVLSGLDVRVEVPYFTGALVDLSHGSGGWDSGLWRFEGCNFFGMGTPVGLRLRHSICGVIRDCQFGGLDVPVLGKEAASDYVNVIRLENVHFANAQRAAVRNPGEAWGLIGCTFEGPGPSLETDFDALTTTIQGSWCGDSAPTRPWFQWRGKGLSFTGNLVQNGVCGLEVRGEGVQVAGNTFRYLQVGVDGLEPSAAAANAFVQVGVPVRI